MRRRRSARRGLALFVLFAVISPALALTSADAKPKKPVKTAPKEEPKRAADTSPPIITHVRVTRAPVGAPIVVRAKFDDEHEIFMPALYVRAQGTQDFETIAMTRGEDGWEGTIPARPAPVTLEYFLEAFDDQGNGPSREGSPESPIRLVVGEVGSAALPGGELPKVLPKDEAPAGVVGHAVPAEEDDSLATKWWFWTIVGVGVTGAVVAAVLALQNQGGRVDAVDVTIIGPDPTRGLP